MDLKELHSMAKQICDKICLRFYYSSSGPDDCNTLIPIVQDDDAKNLIKFVDIERVVNIYIESIEPEVYNQVSGKCQSHHIEMIEVNEESDEDEDSDHNTDGNDSVFSDGFQDSDFEYDDVLYDENIDQEIEWVDGVMSESSGVVDISKKPKEHFMFLNMNQSSKQDGSSKYHVYRGDADQPDFEFEVGLCFNSATDFRDAIRRYSTKQGKPVKKSVGQSYSASSSAFKATGQVDSAGISKHVVATRIYRRWPQTH
ncbi:hypothetical protein C2S52_022511 [Perilla frutescens var. hirtella]|nr:hypothetical protein C2S52_022511 [Perilla frutescens var. hirtella]